MARASVTTQQVTRDGMVPALTPAGVDGDVIDCGNVILWVDNAGGASITVTVPSTATVDGLAVDDVSVVVAAGGFELIGPFPKRSFGQADGAVESGADDSGRAYVDYSDETSVTRAVVSF